MLTPLLLVKLLFRLLASVHGSIAEKNREHEKPPDDKKKDK